MARRKKTRSIDWRPWALRAAVWGALLALLAWGAGLFVTAGTPDKIHAAAFQASIDAGLVVDDIVVTGRVQTDPGTLRAAIGAERGTPMFALDPAAIRARVAGLEWVADARVARRWPDVVAVTLHERRPMARWGAQLLDTQGQVIARPGAGFTFLPAVSGRGAPEHTAALLALVAAEPEIAERLDRAERVGRRRWDLVLRGAVRVQLPAEEEGLALAAVARRHADTGLLDAPGQVVDARNPGRLFVRPAESG